MLEKGQKFGKLTVLGESEIKNGRTYEKCVCECGNVKWIYMSNLTRGLTKSCGCNRSERAKQGCNHKHGMRNTRIYGIYCAMRNRCENKSQVSYKYYGGKGIKCGRNTFDEFYKEMGPSYEQHVRQYGEKNTTIDRINPNGNYSKENCRWATRKEQAATHNKTVVYGGVEYKSITELSNSTGMPYSTIRWKIKHNKLK